jgi:Glycine zipper 2TM domain
MVMTNAVRRWFLLVALLTAGGCATEPPQSSAAPQEAPPPDTNVYFYPMAGHAPVSPEQQDRDKYECNAWAVQQTGFDPSQPSVPPHQRVQALVGGPPPGSGVVTGALAGAVIGSVVSNPWHAGENTLIGALAGATIGGIADAERTAQANRLEDPASNDA